MKYDIYIVVGNRKTLFKENVTEDVVDKFWNSLKWWERNHVEIRESKIVEKNDESR